LGAVGALAIGVVVQPAAAAADQEAAQYEDRDRREQRVHDADADAAQHAGRVADPAGQRGGLLLELARDVVVGLEVAQPVVALHERREVAGVLGKVLRQVVGLLDDRRDQGGEDQAGNQDQPQ
jgi:hypothetical protein